MDNKIVTARFATDDNYVNVYDVYQWDYGQVLRIEGLKLPNMVEIHFSLQETSGEAKTRIGVTKDGVTDVVIPDSFLENEGIGDDYKIFAWIYIADKDSGSTEYKITIHIKARAKPEITHGGQDGEVFQEAVEAVRDAAARAAESEKQAEGWAHGREDIPERAEDNAMHYAGKASEDAKKTAQDRVEVERLVESVSGIGEQVTKVEKLSKDAQEAATQAELHKQAAETAKESVENLSAQVQKNKESVDKTAQDFKLTAQQALADVNNAGQTQTERVQTAGNTAVENIKTAQNTATGAVETAKAEAIKTVADKGKEVLETIPDFNAKLETKLDKNQGVEHAGKALVIGKDGNVVPGEVQTEGVGDAADAIVNTASGTLLNIKDSAERKNKGFGVSGKTAQDGTPTPDAPVEIVNAGKLNEDTGKYEVDVKVTGKNLINEKSLKNFENYTKQGSTYYIYRIRGLINGVQYTLSRGDVASGNKMIFGISVNGQTYDNSSFLVYDGLGSSYNRKSITWTQNNVDYADILFSYNANQSQTTAERLKELFDRIEYIQLEYGNSPTAHEVIKKSQSVMLTSDRPLTKWDKLVEQDGQIGWLYETKKVTIGTNLEWFSSNSPSNLYFATTIADAYGGKSASFCRTYKNINDTAWIEKYANYYGIYGDHSNIGTGDKCFRPPNETITTLEQWKQWLNENPLEIVYHTKSSQFVHLPQSEQDAIRALQTYYPTTVVSNSEDMEMELTYVADTKNYTDRKIEQAVSAQTQSLANLLSLMPLSTQAAMIENDTNNILDNMEVQK